MSFIEYDSIYGNIPNDFFGSIISISSENMAIGSKSSIYIYKNVNQTLGQYTWELHSTISLNITKNNIYINGIHLIITDGTTIYPYVYSSSNDTWEQKNTITPNDNYIKNLGHSIKIYNNTMYISDNCWSPDTSLLYLGKVFIYTLNGNNRWDSTGSISLHNDDRNKNDKFGTCIDANADFLIISAPTKKVGIKKYSGKVYIYNRSNNDLLQTITSYPVDQNVEFGTSCIITSNNNILVGAPRYSNKYIRSGAVYFFTYNGSNSWSFTKKIKPDTEIKYGLFGQSIYMDENNTAVIGYPGYDNYGNNNTGAIYVYDNILTSEETYIQINNEGWLNLAGREMYVFKENTIINIIVGLPNNGGNNTGAISILNNEAITLIYYNQSQIMFGNQMVIQ